MKSGKGEVIREHICKSEVLSPGVARPLDPHVRPSNTKDQSIPQTHPRDGPQKRWRDVIRKDLKEIRMPEDKWYENVITFKVRW